MLACTAEIIPSRIPSGSFSVVDEPPFPLLREDKVTIKMVLNIVSPFFAFLLGFILIIQ